MFVDYYSFINYILVKQSFKKLQFSISGILKTFNMLVVHIVNQQDGKLCFKVDVVGMGMFCV